MASFYEQKMLRLFERYELSDNARVMFRALDEFKTARLDEAALGRLIRLSPSNRAALVNTMVKCANIMKDKPKEGKYCLSIITSCGDMLKIADKPLQPVGFPGFAKLPLEIRLCIYAFYVSNGNGSPSIIPHPKRGYCECAPHEPPVSKTFPVVDMALALTSKQISTEFLTFFYRKRRFYFPCACEMNCHLTNNKLLHSTMDSVMFHWCGTWADKGIQHLKELTQLEEMTVVISKATSHQLTSRQIEIRDFFGAKRISRTLTDSLGWDELITIRGLKAVRVLHIDKRKADRRTDEERKCLENMLNFYLLRPAENQQ
ncbi:hypothetical protein F5Y14DRAFT_290344 [Nemania sp. NC0429]|nr:hypothetical protein F5Y14DRAFT_290344 [Nemania sp. NC0429]